ncbi:MAG: Holliday junction resolvase-like protein [Terriglobales bacterium]
MSDRTAATDVINTLRRGGFNIECPCCQDEIKLEDAGLFYFDDFTSEAQAIYEEMQAELKARRQAVQEQREGFSKTSFVTTTAVNIGNLCQHLLPSLDGFRYACSDCRTLFMPIDYMIFDGLCDTGRVSKILFVDVKTGGADLSARQKAIRDLVRRKKVDFDICETRK